MSSFWVAVGGAVGALLRHVLSQWGSALLGREGAILFINALGSFILAFLAAHFWTESTQDASNTAKLFLSTGLLGGFTTYSTFNLQVLSLLQNGQIVKAVFYLLGTFMICLAVGFLGIFLARMVH